MKKLSFSSLLLVNGLIVGCASGSSERPSDGPRIPEPALTGKPVPPLDVDAGPSELDGLARANQPTESRVDDVPAELICDKPFEGKPLHRLNRTEFNNTVRDLLGNASNPANDFPRDDFGDSFDNNAQALSVSPLLTESYLQAAEDLAQAALAEDSSARDELLTCDARTVGARNCATQVMQRFLYRAFRRPVLDSEVETYVDLVLAAREQGLAFEQAIATGIEAALLSPHFLFKVELDVDPASSAPHALTPFETAVRLSYFVWSSMPDDKLFAAAENGELATVTQIRKQLERMLEDDKSDALLDAFVGRWLETDDIAESNQPASDVFPDYDDSLKAAMQAETRRFMKDVLTGKLPFDEILSAEYSYVNAPLAQLYGLEGTFDGDLKRVDLSDTERVGLLTQASLLTLTGAPTRTSPVRRGVYVLSNLLCDAPPPPPPNVETDLSAEAEATFADLTRAHSEDPKCAGCHLLMDPIGLGLENFDAIGRYRERENNEIIDASGELNVEGNPVAFNGAKELSKLLSEDERLARCAVKKLFTFAHGRIPPDKSSEERCRVDALTDVLIQSNYDFSQLLATMTLTDSFRERRGGVSSKTESQ